MPLYNPSSSPVKASGAELDTGTDDAKFATAKAINDSHNVPSVAPSTSGNIMTSNGTDWTSAAPSGGGTKIATDTTQYTAPANTNENTVYTVALPAGVLGTSNMIRARVILSTVQTSGGTNITWRVKLGATTIGTLVFNSTATGSKGVLEINIVANASASAQKTSITQISSSSSIYGSYNTSTVDTSGALNLVLTIQKADTGTVVVESIVVEKII